MKRYSWPRITERAVRLIPPDHVVFRTVADQIVSHGRLGQQAFTDKRFVDAKYHRDVCGLLLWRLGVDGLTEDGQLKLDGAKYETRLPGRWSSGAAKEIRESSPFVGRAPGALMNHVACDHIVPRNCVAETLVRPGWWNPEDVDGGRRFIMAHAEIAVLSPGENQRLKDKDLEARMPAAWWDAPLDRKSEFRFARYEAVEPRIEVNRWSAQSEARS